MLLLQPVPPASGEPMNISRLIGENVVESPKALVDVELMKIAVVIWPRRTRPRVLLPRPTNAALDQNGSAATLTAEQAGAGAGGPAQIASLRPGWPVSLRRKLCSSKLAERPPPRSSTPRRP